MKKSISEPKAESKLKLSAELLDKDYQPKSAIFVEQPNGFYYQGSEQSTMRMLIDKKGQSLKVISQIPHSKQSFINQRDYYEQRIVEKNVPKKVNVCKIGLMIPAGNGMVESILYRNQKSPSCKVTEYKEKHPSISKD